MQDEEVLHTWLVGLRLDDYYEMFVIAGYDMPTISRMTPEVRTAFCYGEKFHLVELNILVQNSSKTTKKFFTFDVSTSIRGLHRKKLVLGLLLPVLGAIS